MRDKAKKCAQDARYRQKHREEIAAKKNRYYQEHREEIAAKKTRYRQEHRDERIRYYQEHREALLANRVRYYQEHREEGRIYALRYQKEHREERTRYAKEQYRCAKELCPRANPAVTIKITCPVCGKTFGCTGSRFNHSLKQLGHPPRYCSGECRNIANTKHWQQNHSPYAIRIKELTKRTRIGGRP